MKFNCFFPVIFIFSNGLSKYFESTTASLPQWKLQDQNNKQFQIIDFKKKQKKNKALLQGIVFYPAKSKKYGKF